MGRVKDDKMSDDEQLSGSPQVVEVTGHATGVLLAIGASGGKTSSLLRLLRAGQPEPTIATILILQFREALNEEAFRDALGTRAAALVTPKDGQRPEPGQIYLFPANLIVTLEEGRFRFRPAEQASGERGIIDSFLTSLAHDQDGNVIGLILDGTGVDGTLGIASIKEAGGLALVEETAKTDELDPATTNHPAALADFVLPVTELFARIATHARHHVQLREAAQLETQIPAEVQKLGQIAAVLRDRTGHDFHGYKRATFLRRVHRRMQVVQVEGIDAYLEVLRAQPGEPQLLFNDLLIGVTKFFRDRKEFDFLEASIIPKLFEGKNSNDQLRVWVLGCSTGEEAFSIGILLREQAARVDTPPQIQIFASDIDGRALAVARVGRYPTSIEKDVSPERLARWFVKEGDTYCVGRELRETSIFSQHSIVKDPPFSRLDLVSCRNLLIYLGTDLQSRVIPIFHFALKASGYLFLGNAENVSRHAQLFAPVDRTFRIFQRLDSDYRGLPDFPYAQPVRHSPAASPEGPPVPESLAHHAGRITERHAPGYAIIDEGFNVQHFSSKAGRFIHPASGTPSLKLLDLVHTDLRAELRSALSRAAVERAAVQVNGLRMNENGRSVLVDLVVEPIAEGEQVPRGYVVLFEEIKSAPEVEASAGISQLGGPPDEHVRRLEAELRATRERLQAMLEELQSTNEELKSSNEEYQSLNEELQSANEELQTSKEELQSVNEEVTTVNGELGQRVHDFTRANSDLKNLLESTQIATIFLDNDLQVTKFTPAAAEIFHLIETDLGRPIEHIKSRISYDELQDDAQRVIRSLATTSREVDDPVGGRRYIVRALPYRSIDNFIGGAVITFTDITPIVQAERALRQSEERLRLVMESIPQLVWTAVEEGRWTWASKQWTDYTGQREEDSRGVGWLDTLHPDDRETTVSAWHEALSSGEFSAECRIRAADGTYRWHQNRATPLSRKGSDVVEWFGTSTDVHEMRLLRERQNVLVSELQHRSRNLLGIVGSLSSRTIGRGGRIEDFEDRLAALSRAQGLLSRFGNDTVELTALVRAELEAHAEIKQPKVFIQGPEVQLTAHQVQTFSLALHELATNAVKYGALKDRTGQLSVTWAVGQEEGGPTTLTLDWVESGMSLEPEKMTRRGYGRELIERALTYSLRAETKYALKADGARCLIKLPLN